MRPLARSVALVGLLVLASCSSNRLPTGWLGIDQARDSSLCIAVQLAPEQSTGTWHVAARYWSQGDTPGCGNRWSSVVSAAMIEPHDCGAGCSDWVVTVDAPQLVGAGKSVQYTINGSMGGEVLSGPNHGASVKWVQTAEPMVQS